MPKEKDKYYGLLWGYIADIEDPKNLNRVRAYVPAIAEPKTTGWLTPGAWPGSGKERQGSQYPVQVGGSIGIFFEQGDPNGKGMYLGTTAGLSESRNTADFPTRLWFRTSGQPDATGQPDPVGQNRTATLWEDDNIAVFVDFDRDFEVTAQQPRYAQRFVVADKRRNSHITMNVAAGEKQDTVAIILDSAGQIRLSAKGGVFIEGNPVEINGRRVMPYGSKPI